MVSKHSIWQRRLGIVGLMLVCLWPAAGYSQAPQEITSIIDYHSFVNAGYTHLPKLRGWQTTRDLIGTTLGCGEAGRFTGEHREDGTPAQLAQFLAQLPSPGKGHTQVIYLASQQASDGAWVFTDRSRAFWSDLIARVPKRSGEDGLRVVLLDSCYARKATMVPGWQEWASMTLCAASEREVTWEIDFSKRQPKDFRTRLPAVWDWLAHRARTPRASFLGVLWLDAWLTDPPLLSTPEAWRSFLEKLPASALRFKEKHGGEFASSPSLILP